MLNRKILIAAHALKGGGGISVGYNFICALLNAMPDAEYWVTIPQGVGYEEAIGSRDNVHYLLYRKKGHLHQWWYENFDLPGVARDIAPDITIGLGNRALTGISSPQLVLLHDPHLFYPVKHYARESSSRKMLKSFQRRRLAADLGRLAILLVQTDTAEARVRECFAYTGRVVKIPNAISKNVEPLLEYPEPDEFRTYRNYFKLFYLTRYYPHKNIEFLVDLFERYPDRTKNIRLFLTIDSKQHTGAKRLLHRLEKNRLRDRIINVGPLRQNQLGQFFSHSDALVMPTTLESYSGAYLEAMAFRTPILTSDLDFAREICGDAALYFNPWDIESLATSLDQVIKNKDLREKLKVLGAARLKCLQVNWNTNGRRVATLIDEMLSNRSCDRK